MTQTDAAVAVNKILDALIAMGLAPGGTPFVLRGGSLVAKEIALNPSCWTVVWMPADERLLPIQLGHFGAKVAAQKIARYQHDRYTEIRLQLEKIFRHLEEDSLRPREMHSTPDSYDIGRCQLEIVERPTPQRMPNYRITLETDSSPTDIAPGKRFSSSKVTDVTDLDLEDIRSIIKRSTLRS